MRRGVFIALAQRSQQGCSLKIKVLHHVDCSSGLNRSLRFGLSPDIDGDLLYNPVTSYGSCALALQSMGSPGAGAVRQT